VGKFFREINLKKTKYILIFLFLGTINVCSQIAHDTAQIVPKVLPQAPLEVYTGRDFTYTEPSGEPNVIERFLSAVWQTIVDFINNLFDWNLRASTVSGRQALWISLVVLMVALIVVGGVFMWKKFHKVLGRSDEENVLVEEAERNLNKVDFEKLIENAYKAQNYRLSVRFFYLKILKSLSERQLIEYEYQKTNHEYYYEIKDENLLNLFKDLSLVFDYCWYGEYQADEQDFLFAKQKWSY
jgi:flagellar basal body-associated protein FliL